MKTIITNVQQFENSTKCSRGTSKNIIDAFILCYNITNDDLIADIYSSCGTDGTEQNIIDMNKIENKIKEKRNGHYVHALEVFEVNELMEVVQHIISEFTEEEGYTIEDIKEFFNTIYVYHLEDEESDEETNEIRQDEIYSFDFNQYIDNLYE